MSGAAGGRVLLSSVAQEFVPGGNWAGTDWQASDLAESGAIPVMVSEESLMKDYGNDERCVRDETGD